MTPPKRAQMKSSAKASLAAVLFALATPAHAQQLVVLDARVISDNDRIRVLLDLSEDGPFRVTIAPGSNLLAIDLLSRPIATGICDALRVAPEVVGCAAGRTIFGYSRIAVHLAACGSVDNAVLAAPIGGEPAQLFIDIVPLHEDQLCERAPR